MRLKTTGPSVPHPFRESQWVSEWVSVRVSVWVSDLLTINTRTKLLLGGHHSMQCFYSNATRQRSVGLNVGSKVMMSFCCSHVWTIQAAGSRVLRLHRPLLSDESLTSPRHYITLMWCSRLSATHWRCRLDESHQSQKRKMTWRENHTVAGVKVYTISEFGVESLV